MLPIKLFIDDKKFTAMASVDSCEATNLKMLFMCPLGPFLLAQLHIAQQFQGQEFLHYRQYLAEFP